MFPLGYISFWILIKINCSKLFILKVVDNFNYLGTSFNYTGNISLNQKYLADRALNALDIRMYNCKRIPLTLKTQCQLFDSFVGSILGYGS